MKNILVFLLTWFIFLQFLDILKISLPTVFFLCRMRFWKILLFVFLSRYFLGILPLIFCKFWHGGRNPYEVVQDSAIFKKFFFWPKIGKIVLWWKFIFFVCSCSNPIFGKIFIPKIWSKMFSANQIAVFYNQSYLQKEWMK